MTVPSSVTTLRFDGRCLAQLLQLSRERAPIEACGLLVGRRSGAEIVVLDVPSARNVAAQPEREFALDPGDVVALHDAAASAGAAVVGTWHSHVHGEARPSRADLGGAWPGHVLLIVAGEAARAFVVEGGRPRDLLLAGHEARFPDAHGGPQLGG
jgi:proteasome lid subunit RPN8/RPN11